MRATRKRPRPGFTLVEILIVLTIILLVTTIAAPAIYSALNGRQVTDGARVFTGALAGVRDAAIRANEPRGIRLLPDPVRTIPPPGDLNAGTVQLVFNRMVQIEPAGDYNEGKVNIGPVPISTTTFPPAYPVQINSTDVWPYSSLAPNTQVLMIEEAVFQGGYVLPVGSTVLVPNPPTNWYWNIRLGEKVKLNGTGRSYTVVGPCVVNPNGTGTNKGNYDLFVNVGLPGTTSPLARPFYDATGNVVTTMNPEFLFLVNGEDDDGDGYVDEGWDGYNNNSTTGSSPAARGLADELEEWETEKWAGAAGQMDLVDTDPLGTGNRPSAFWAEKNIGSPAIDASYTIQRRAVPTQGTLETPLPGGVVIDATTWNKNQERSRYLPIVNATLTCDIMLNPNGQLVTTSLYSTPTSGPTTSFIHFWLTDVTDVHPRGAVWGLDTNGQPNNPPSGVPYELPMTEEVLGPNGAVQKGLYPPAGALVPTPILKGDRRLVTLFTRNGIIVTNTIESIEPTSANMPGEGFKIDDVGYPFLKAQLGQREAR